MWKSLTDFLTCYFNSWTACLKDVKKSLQDIVNNTNVISAGVPKHTHLTYHKQICGKIEDDDNPVPLYVYLVWDMVSQQILSVIWVDDVGEVISRDTVQIVEDCDCYKGKCAEPACNEEGVVIPNLGGNSPVRLSTNPATGVPINVGLGENEQVYYDFSNCSNTIELTNLGDNVTYKVRSV